MASAPITVERGVVGFGLDYACAHIIIPESINLLPIQANFVTERVIGGVFSIGKCRLGTQHMSVVRNLEVVRY